MFNLLTTSPFREAELAYRQERILAHVDGQRASRALRPRASRGFRLHLAPTRRSRMTAARHQRSTA